MKNGIITDKRALKSPLASDQTSQGGNMSVTRICSVKDCTREVSYSKMCALHINRSRAGIDLAQPLRYSHFSKPTKLLDGTEVPKKPVMCFAAGCELNTWARGLCSRHYQLWRRNGSTTPKITPVGQPLQYFKEQVLLETDNCLIWPYSKRNSGGYGGVVVNGVGVSVHRLALLTRVGQPPIGKSMALHKCGVRGCFNYKHLYWGSSKDNARDMVSDGTNYVLRGSANRQSKLTENIVADILKSGLSSTKLSIKYSVAPSTIRGIKQRKTWKHVLNNFKGENNGVPTEQPQ